MTGIVQTDRDGGVGLLVLNKPPVNAIGVALRTAVLEAFHRLLADDAVEAIVICGHGRCFSAGADIKDFAHAAEPPTLPELLIALSRSPKPVIAALHGIAFGGGLELALAAHLRVGIRGLRLALPEVKLGLLPGAGGTQRLARLVGIENAIDVICTGRDVLADEALSLGILSRLVDGDVRDAGIAAARDVLSGKLRATPTDTLQVASDEAAVSAARSRYAKGLSAPMRALDAVAAATLPIDQGLAVERKLFMELMQSEERAGLVHAFFAERATAKIPERAATSRTVETIAIIGGGTMGTGIAAAFSIAGFPVTVVETEEARAAAARTNIERTLAGALSRGKLSDSAHAEALKQLVATTDLNALAELDLVIEAVFENMDVKQELFGKLDAICKPDTIFATNTSYLDVNDIAAATTRPQNVVGLHFFSPAHIMRLLEVVVAEKTSSDVVATAFTLAKKLRKIPVRSGVCDGFIGNRILTRYRKCCEYLVLDGASFEQVDQALTQFGFAMGPFAVGDLSGLDIARAARDRLAASRPAEERYSRVADRLCDEGWFGRKSGKGYYLYVDGKLTGANPGALTLVDEERQAQGIAARTFTDDEIVARCLAAMIQEATDALQEGIALRPVDIDAVKLFGFGFPRHRGGPLHMADRIGIDAVVAGIESYAQEDAYFWRVPPLLRDMLKRGKSFADFNAESSDTAGDDSG